MLPVDLKPVLSQEASHFEGSLPSIWLLLSQLQERRGRAGASLYYKVEENCYRGLTQSGKEIFFARPLTVSAIEYMSQIFPPSPLQSEERLSHWNAFGEWLQCLQENHTPYRVEFQYSKKGLPHWIQVDFSQIQVRWYVGEANLFTIIEGLNTIKSSLRVYRTLKEARYQVRYHPKEYRLQLSREVQQTDLSLSTPLKAWIPIGEWWFVPEEGFYTAELADLLRSPAVYGADIPHLLTEHGEALKEALVECSLHQHPTPLAHALSFDVDWQLHITPYVHTPGDLTQEDAWLMEGWAYVKGKGFYSIEQQDSDSPPSFIPAAAVAEYVTQHRAWFEAQEGFHLHPYAVEAQITYQMTPSHRLLFLQQPMQLPLNARSHHFGNWLYVEQMGFFPTDGQAGRMPFWSGLSLNAEQIPLFIHHHREALQTIPHFFASRCLLSSITLDVSWSDTGKIKVTPAYHFPSSDAKREFVILEDFLYVAGEGFCELPPALRLPEQFRQPCEIGREEIAFFLTHELDTLTPWITALDSSLSPPSECRLTLEHMSSIPERGKGWHALELSYHTERGCIPVQNVWQACTKHMPFAFEKVGRLDLSDSRYEWLRRLTKDRFSLEEGTIALKSLEVMRLHALEPMVLSPNASPQLRAQWEEFIYFRPPHPPSFSGLLSQLRPYQEGGAKWLWFLYRHGLSGLLCDDMGLGKTHQAMALLAAAANWAKEKREEGVQSPTPRFLIVCPTSVIYHWEEKLQQFLPGLHTHVLYGAQRNLKMLSECDILLTSYGILRNEVRALSKISFEIAVFDEIQIAKNQCSRIYQSLIRLKSEMKLGITGTPIENHLRELKSLFDIVLPAYMPAERDYRECFIKPIEREGDIQRKTLLNRLVHPFVLRRKKEDVLQELPDKMEEVALCELLPDQHRLYTEVLQRRRHYLLEELYRETEPVPYLHIFSLLSSLKQICDHPAVYLKRPLDYHHYASGKWQLCLELLQEARESRQKVVIFSQYLGMLDILAHALQTEGIQFASIRGDTRDRKAQLSRFQTDPTCEVFIGSLHAAGLGIDLTAASVVIHYDRWWNAARENQATDRVHRMGQKRGVQVFKLVTKGTFEEKIHLMIERKAALLEEVIGVDDHHVLKTFSRQELIALLELAEAPPDS